MKKLLLSIALSAISLTIFAQQPEVVTQTFVADTNFLVVILLGVLLAFGFQVLMTTVSVAIGVISIGNLKEAYVESKYGKKEKDDEEEDDERFEIGASGNNTGVLITSGLGIWNVVTMTISLFAATLLALQLNPIESAAVQVTLGLSIWAAFFMLMFYFESKFIGSIAGTLVSAVVNGLKSSAEAIKSVFTPSQASQAQSMIDNTVEKVRSEFSDAFDTNSVDINETVNNFLNRVERKLPAYEQLKADISEIVSENMPERNDDYNRNNGSNRNISGAKWTAIQTAIQTVVENSETLRQGTKRGKEKINQLQSLATDLRKTYKSADTKTDGVSKVTARVSSLNESDVRDYIEQIKSSIQTAKPEDFNNENLQTKINNILTQANHKANVAVATIKSLDEETVINTLVENTSLSRNDVDKYANQIKNTLQKIQNQLPTNSHGDFGIDKNEVERVKKAIEARVANFIDSTDNDELDYSLLKYDFKRAMNNPSDSLEIIKQRLSTFDRDTIVSIITNNDRVNRSDINKIADQIDAAKSEVNYQIQKMEDKTRSTMKNIERKAVIQAEAARKTMISAASWLLISMIASGAAAVIAGFITVG